MAPRQSTLGGSKRQRGLGCAGQASEKRGPTTAKRKGESPLDAPVVQIKKAVSRLVIRTNKGGDVRSALPHPCRWHGKRGDEVTSKKLTLKLPTSNDH